MAERLTLPVLPLREVVLFPGVTAPIGAGRPATLRAIEAALAGTDRLVFAVSQRQNVESVSSDVLYTIGTIARIGQLQRGLSGMQLLLHGERRGIAIHYTDKEGYLQAVVREAEEMLPLNLEDPAFVGLHREARARAAELGQKSGLPDEVVQQVLAGVNEAGKFADLVDGRSCLRPWASRSGSAACWYTCSARSAWSTPRRTSSPRSRKSWVSASVRCSFASR
jgi:ATP-dependent Lon protease